MIGVFKAITPILHYSGNSLILGHPFCSLPEGSKQSCLLCALDSGSAHRSISLAYSALHLSFPYACDESKNLTIVVASGTYTLMPIAS